MMTLDLFNSTIERLLDEGGSLLEVARALGQPRALITHDDQMLHLHGRAGRVLVYRIVTDRLSWMVLIPHKTHCTFEAYDLDEGSSSLVQRLQRALR